MRMKPFLVGWQQYSFQGVATTSVNILGKAVAAYAIIDER